MVRVALNVRPLFVDGTNAVELEKPTCRGVSIWNGAMKMPKPPRTTVFWFTCQEAPKRGSIPLLSVSQAARLFWSANVYPPRTRNWSGVRGKFVARFGSALNAAV